MEPMMVDKLVRYTPDLGFIAPDVEDGEDFDYVEFFLDCLHTWVMETHADDIRDNITVEDA